MTFPKTFQKNLRVKPKKKNLEIFGKKKFAGKTQKKIKKKVPIQKNKKFKKFKKIGKNPIANILYI